jgi:hypothetical protein
MAAGTDEKEDCRMTSEDDEFVTGDYKAAERYISDHPEFALCRVRHDVRLQEPPVDMKFEADGTETMIYICHGCGSEYHRRYWPDGRYHSGKWVYAAGYVAEPGTGYGLLSRSGKAAFNQVLRETMRERVASRKGKGRKH